MDEKKKQPRRPNWEVMEVEKLMSGVEKHHSSICGKFSASLTFSIKTKLWEEITVMINSVKGYARTIEECQSKWTHLKSEAKKKEKERIRYRKGTGGGPPPKEVSPLDVRILQLLPKESILGISGAIEVSGQHHLVVAGEEIENVLEDHDVDHVVVVDKEKQKPSSQLSTKSPGKRKVDAGEDPYIVILRQQIEVDKERNEILKQDAADRREFERKMLKMQSEMLMEQRKSNTDDMFVST